VKRKKKQDLSEDPENAINYYISIDYYAVILDLFRPYLQRPGLEPVQLRNFSSAQSTTDSVYAASVNQIKHLSLTYRKNYPAASYSIMWHNAALYLANAMLREARQQPSTLHTGGSRRSSSSAATANSSECQFYIQLCLAGYTDLHVSYPVAVLIARGLLSMGMRDGTMTVSQVSSVARRLDRNGRNHGIAMSDTRASFIVDLDLAVNDLVAAQVGVLADQFDELMMLPRFTGISKEEPYWQSRDTWRNEDGGGDEESGLDIRPVPTVPQGEEAQTWEEADELQD
jgi:hypothetical protein